MEVFHKISRSKISLDQAKGVGESGTKRVLCRSIEAGN
jgi:hypothetical protein